MRTILDIVCLQSTTDNSYVPIVSILLPWQEVKSTLPFSLAVSRCPEYLRKPSTNHIYMCPSLPRSHVRIGRICTAIHCKVIKIKKL